MAKARDKRDEYRKNDDNNEFVGRGIFYDVQEKNLPEVSNVTERLALLFAVGDVLEEIIKDNRKKSSYEIYRDRLLRYRIGINGQGVENVLLAMNAKRELEEAEINKGALFG